ncbi:uncharacterized protein [Temnothorax nylanderi]|uniref:uncharacterized protein n=1 Tax=Temnothorax nylanderi TaxID=102681 RepID=UPI003A88F70B
MTMEQPRDPPKSIAQHDVQQFMIDLPAPELRRQPCIPPIFIKLAKQSPYQLINQWPAIVSEARRHANHERDTISPLLNSSQIRTPSEVKGWPRDAPKKPNENIMHPFSTDGENTIQNRKRAIRIQMRYLSGDTS